MNYYIQGNKDKAAEIKAAFEAKGFECPWEDELGDVQYINVSVIADDCAYVDPIMGGLHLLNVLKTHPDYKELELPKPHYDISNFKPFDKVLVRQDDSCTWGISFFGRYAGLFICCSNGCFVQCIPFEGNEHLLGTTDMPSEEYINW